MLLAYFITLDVLNFIKYKKKKKDLFKVIKVELSKVNTDRHRDKIIHEGLLHFQRRAQRKCYHP